MIYPSAQARGEKQTENMLSKIIFDSTPLFPVGMTCTRIRNLPSQKQDWDAEVHPISLLLTMRGSKFSFLWSFISCITIICLFMIVFPLPYHRLNPSGIIISNN
jgi:hypothetical protein